MNSWKMIIKSTLKVPLKVLWFSIRFPVDAQKPTYISSRNTLERSRGTLISGLTVCVCVCVWRSHGYAQLLERPISLASIVLCIRPISGFLGNQRRECAFMTCLSLISLNSWFWNTSNSMPKTWLLGVTIIGAVQETKMPLSRGTFNT